MLLSSSALVADILQNKYKSTFAHDQQHWFYQVGINVRSLLQTVLLTNVSERDVEVN